MKKSAALEYSGTRLRQVLALNAEGVNVNTLARGFDLKDQDLPRLHEDLKALVKEGFAISDKPDYYHARMPLSDLVVARVCESLADRKTKISLQIEGVDEDFPFAVSISPKMLRRKFGDSGVRENDKIAVVLARHHGVGLIATQVIDRFDKKTPSIAGHFNRRSAAPSFLAFAAGINTSFNVFGKIPETIDPKASYLAHIPENLNPYNPALEIAGEPIRGIIASKYGIRTDHDTATIREARAALRTPIDFKNRRDLTDEKILVIDPADARDHDDGIMIERTRDGYRTLAVVADVPFYLRSGTGLDEAARARGFTHYFPDDTYHMLPKNMVHMASLMEGRSRPVIYVEQFYDLDKRPIGYPEVGAGVIAAQKQMSYGEFEHFVINDSHDISSYIELGDVLINRMREEKPIFDGGQDLKNSYSQALVASMMVKANAAIADFLDFHNIPFLSRSHTGCDNVYAFDDLKNKLLDWDYDVPETVAGMTTEALRGIIQQAEARDDKARVEHCIRSEFLNQAIYTTQRYGHFGLGLQNYAHATSPIRRYPDIITLRGVHTALGNHEYGLSEQDIDSMETIAKEMNVLQDITRRVDLDVKKYHAVRDLMQKQGYTVRASLGRVDSHSAEIVLDTNFGLRKYVDLNHLPPDWAVSRNGKHLIYNNNQPVHQFSPLRLTLANVRPHLGEWDFVDLHPAEERVPAVQRPARHFVPG